MRAPENGNDGEIAEAAIGHAVQAPVYSKNNLMADHKWTYHKRDDIR